MHTHTEAMEEGEVDEVSFAGKGHLNEAGRALVSVLKTRFFNFIISDHFRIYY